jgi:hypothetical protein
MRGGMNPISLKLNLPRAAPNRSTLPAKKVMFNAYAKMLSGSVMCSSLTNEPTSVDAAKNPPMPTTR